MIISRSHGTSIVLSCTLLAGCVRSHSVQAPLPPHFLVGFGDTVYPWPWENIHTPHNGLDVAPPTRTSRAIAIAAGTVVGLGRPAEAVGDQWGVWIYHPVLRKTVIYFHLAEPILVKRGDVVARGQPLGNIFLPTSFSWVMHVHLSVCTNDCLDDKFEDPRPFLKSCISNAAANDVVFPVEC